MESLLGRYIGALRSVDHIDDSRCRATKRDRGVKKAGALQAVPDWIAQMTPEDRALAERVHAKVVVFFQDAGEFSSR
jgi:hypothetical protein